MVIISQNVKSKEGRDQIKGKLQEKKFLSTCGQPLSTQEIQ
jgi:hypothetical protein